jgi:methylated-DNA-[protein]-cysteine S-methyltransferase
VILDYKELDSPVGVLSIASYQDKLTHLILKSHFEETETKLNRSHPLLKEVEKQLNHYFKGKLKVFNVPLSFLEGTEFQRKAWQALTQIPYGKTISYQEQALMIKNPKAVRAIGAANGQNPISIIVPCHRVIGKSGNLVGYGGGLPMKEYLLDLESQFSKAL